MQFLNRLITTIKICTCVATLLPLASLASLTARADTATKQAKIIIEHNATASDTGFQMFVDADGWEKMQVNGPGGQVAEFQSRGAMNDLGITELFLETVEPENAKVPLAETLKRMPEGDYEFIGVSSKMGGSKGQVTGKATLSHRIPGGVTLLEPREGSVIPLANTRLSWQHPGKPVNGTGLKLIAYELIVEKDEDPDLHMIGKRGLSMILPATTTGIDISVEFFEPATQYKWEVLAIEAGGNQTLQSGSFKTQ